MIIDNVTLLCVDSKRAKRAIRSLNRCLEQIPFKYYYFLTDLETNFSNTIKIERLKTKKEYSHFCINQLYKYFETSHCLIVQHDSWIVNPQKWKDEWLNYDYIGCNTFWMDEKGGNGGFSLRSHKLMLECAKLQVTKRTHPEDVFLSGPNGFKNSRRAYFEDKGLKFATKEIQNDFGLDEMVYAGAFGHHQCVFM